jgi:hypothetical protein
VGRVVAAWLRGHAAAPLLKGRAGAR